MSAPLLFASTNPGKLRELRALATGLKVVSPNEVPQLPDVEETESTLEGNARKKAIRWAQASSLVTLADDSGLFVDALGGRPGIHSARYAPGDDRARVRRLLQELEGVAPGLRTAAFQCALCLAAPSGQAVVEVGSCHGTVTTEPRGTAGFGYDPVLFVPELGRTLAEVSLAEKAHVSHRAQAFARMTPWLLAYAAGNWP